MRVGVFQTAATLALVAAFYIMDFALIARFDRQRRAAGSGRSWDYTLFVAAATGVLALQPLLLPALSLRIDAGWGLLVQAAGVLLAAGGLILQAWARVHLRQFYAERVEVQAGHQVIDSGPYAYVRHPTFTSFFLCTVGLLLINPALPTLLATVYVFWDFSHAARQEEALLSQTIPGYAAYMARTARFFPGLRPRAPQSPGGR